jgi:Tol biopolymer transport system component
VALLPGTRIGPYQISTQIGVGGMGEVYRATDTNLMRQVAIKVLPEAVASDAERLARFDREAKTLASLNHPNIAAIYGLEKSAGTTGLIMELVEGPSLADRLADGAIAVDEALAIATQIAEAVEAAHEQGIIHRDLKPANVKLRPDGVVKVLDFGLAKATEAIGTSASHSQSPTITTPAMTQAGVVLGTAAYMSPEQAKGKPVDKRSDVWAFGCVLYEMLAGNRTFEGEGVTDTLTSVIAKEPDWNALPSNTPAPIHKLLRRCLEKDRKRRLRDIGEARLVIEEVLTLPASERFTAVGRLAPMRHGTAVASLIGLVAAVLAGTLVWFFMQPVPSRVVRLTMSPTGAGAVSFNDDRVLTMTADGSRVIYAGNDGRELFVRALDQLEPATIFSASTGGLLRGLFASPDSQWVGFVQGSTLMKIGITGGPPVTLVATDGPSRGATWLADDTVVFATGNVASGLQRVPAGGGPTTVLTRPNGDLGEADHIWPEQLPDGRGVLFTIVPTAGGFDGPQIAVLDFATGRQTTVVRSGSHAHYVVSGHLVYTVGETLRAVAFDLDRLTVHGTSVQVVSRLVKTNTGGGQYAVAADGTLVYADRPGGASDDARTMVWVDRQGREEPLGAPPRSYLQPRVSPDGTRVVVSSADQQRDLWRWDLPRGPLTRLTSNPGLDFHPLWTPDSRRVVFASQGGVGAVNVYGQAADGTGSPERLTESRNTQSPTAVAPDNSYVLFHEVTATRGFDLWLQILRPQSHMVPLLETRFDERLGAVSPNGTWLAYESNSSGTFEIYVRPFAKGDERQWQISTAGGTRPLWARDGRELYYVTSEGTLMAVPVEPGNPAWRAGPSTTVVAANYVIGNTISGRNYDVSPDGRRFLMLKGVAAAAAPQLVVVQHWVEELKARVPTK